MKNHTKQELIKLWSGDAKRKAFIGTYKEWGVWLTVPELDLVFYRYELPDGCKIFVMEYQQKMYHRFHGEGEYHTATRVYLQKYEHFMPEQVSENFIAGHLMELKAKLLEEVKS